MLIGASIGTLLYTNFMKSNVYGIAAFGFICSAFLSLTLEPDIAQISTGKRISLQDLKDQLKLSVVVIHENHYMFSLIVIMGALQFILQPFFNYW